jgi:excisionase family DNA binding protein
MEKRMDRLLTADEAAEYLGVSLQTLYGWRWKRIGPRAAKVGRELRYRQRDIEAWLDEQSPEQSNAS